MNELKIDVSHVGESFVTVLHLSGHLHGETEFHLMENVRQIHQSGSKHLLLDLTGVEVITSAGLRAIHNAFKLFTPLQDVNTMHSHNEEPYKSPYFKLVCPNPHVYYVLNVAGFLQNILIYHGIEEAVGSFTG